jgi:transposase
MNKFLTEEQVKQLKIMHKKERDKRVCDRIKAVLLFHDEYTYEEIAKILLLDDGSVRRHIEEYIDNAKLTNNHIGSVSKINENQAIELVEYLQDKIQSNVNPIIDYVKSKYNILYSKSGMTTWLKVNNFSYKKPQQIPHKLNCEAQEAFIEVMQKIKDSGELLFFGDGVHPTHQSKAAYGWIYKGSKVAIHTNATPKRVNISGVINIDSKEMLYVESETINSQTITELFDKLIARYGSNVIMNIIIDNAKYQKSVIIKEYLEKNVNLIVHYLPAYSPNLNLIERVWKFMHKKVRNNKHYKHFKDFKSSILDFFNNFHQYKDDMDKLLNFKFQRMDFTIGKFAN